MKTSFIQPKQVLITCMLILFACITGISQQALPKIGIVYIDAKGWAKEEPLTQLVRIELSKLSLYEVLDRYDIEDVLRTNNIQINTCLNRECILHAGELLKTDYMLSGSINKLGGKVVLMFRQFEVKTGNTTKTITKEFSDDNKDMDVLIEVTLKEMYGIPITEENKKHLDEKNSIPTAVSNSKSTTISMGGPRFGFGFLTGTAAEFATRSKDEGGLGGYPAMFQFGYQFEKMYLSEGNLQAIFEFIPTISGVEQGHFVPSFTILNGFRSASTGWEIAFGPTITWTRAADMYQDASNNWRFARDYNGWKYDSVQMTSNFTPNPYEVVSRNHTGGSIVAKPGLLIGFGKTFKTGKLNMPLNFYVIPRKNSLQFGVSYGFNVMRKK